MFLLVLAACGGTPTFTGVDVRVGSRTMHLVCVGPTDTGEPTIVLVAGGAGDHLSWDAILDRMQSTHRLCAYDRAGAGKSEPPTEASRTFADEVGDLRALLDAAGVRGPFVIGSHSVGANHAILFTDAFPSEVVGLLFVDPQSPRADERFLKALPARRANEPAKIAEFRESLETFSNDPSLNPGHVHLRPSFEAAASALDKPGPLFGDRPVVVLSAEATPGHQSGLPRDLAKEIDEIWAAAQQELAAESAEGSLEKVSGAGHFIQKDEPRVVIDALEMILKALA